MCAKIVSARWLSQWWNMFRVCSANDEICSAYDSLFSIMVFKWVAISPLLSMHENGYLLAEHAQKFIICWLSVRKNYFCVPHAFSVFFLCSPCHPCLCPLLLFLSDVLCPLSHVYVPCLSSYVPCLTFLFLVFCPSSYVSVPCLPSSVPCLASHFQKLNIDQGHVRFDLRQKKCKTISCLCTFQKTQGYFPHNLHCISCDYGSCTFISKPLAK